MAKVGCPPKDRAGAGEALHRAAGTLPGGSAFPWRLSGGGHVKLKDRHALMAAEPGRGASVAGLRELGWGEGQCRKSLEQGSDRVRLLVKGPPGISGEAEGRWQ